ncbi:MULTISPECIES: hypothetical protein [unclassified Caballeronia]|uniref:hypothetical protein n=1 Tax=unclassified Caballeronia TaxID=2646786 RepID=UPI002854C298|nr:MULTISPECIES: hypothetical protein [unclassified Caballeronia]MDR5815689.1 hypothetical protein [Caballeronia sp. LZ033]MDR5883432.1 hypothetical protein [Caballeronia sp. LZ032]
MTTCFKAVYFHLERIVSGIGGRREMVITAVQVSLSMIAGIHDASLTARSLSCPGFPHPDDNRSISLSRSPLPPG